MRRTPGLFRLHSAKTFQYRCRVHQDLVTRIGARLVEVRRRQVAGCDVNAIGDPADAFLAARGISLEPGSLADFAVRFHGGPSPASLWRPRRPPHP